jgi:hypothetical protein
MIETLARHRLGEMGIASEVLRIILTQLPLVTVHKSIRASPDTVWHEQAKEDGL